MKLMLLGKGWYQGYNLYSPSNAVCILLDTLKKDNIQKVLEKRFPNLSASTREEWAGSILKRTGGVPRLVDYACAFLKENYPSSSQVPLTNWAKNLLEKPFYEYLKATEEGLRQLISFDRGVFLDQEHFERIISMSVLRFPLPLDSKEPAKYWAIPNAPDEIEVPLLEILRLYNLYIEKEAEKWRILFPQVTTEAIAESEWGKISPFFVEILQHAGYKENIMGDLPPKSEDTLENLAVRVVKLRLQQFLHNTVNPPLGELFPFLQSSFIEKKVLHLDSLDIHGFKLVDAEKKGRTKQLLKLRGKNRIGKIEAIKRDLERNVHLTSAGRNQVKTCNVKDWRALLPLLKPNTLYALKSFPSDLFVTSTTETKKREVVAPFHVQLKSGGINLDVLINEVEKVAYSYTPGVPLTLLIVSLESSNAISQDLLKHGGKKVIVNGEDLAIRILAKDLMRSKKHWRSWGQIEIDVVFLLKAGIKEFLGSYNYRFITRHE